MATIDEFLRRFGVDPSAAPPDELEEFVYAVAAQELREGNPRPGLMAKAFADSNGEDRKTEALYLRLRAAQLRRDYERAAEAKLRQEEAARPRPKPAPAYDPTVPPNPMPTRIIVGALAVVIVLFVVVALLVNA